MEEKKVKQKSNGWGIAAFIVALVAIALSFIPIVNNAAFFLGGIAVIFGIIALATKSAKALPIVALILGVLAIVITIAMQNSVSKAIDEAVENIDKTIGNKTEDVLAEDVKVEIGAFTYSVDQYGLPESKLNVTVTNIGEERMSYSITIEALDPNGTRIETDSIYANDVAPNQTINCDAFTLVTSDVATALQNATFTIIEASAY